ncbi:MAG: transporter [Psychroflexus sp.]|nr:transporter [Psychroflexus sp.]
MNINKLILLSLMLIFLNPMFGQEGSDDETSYGEEDWTSGRPDGHAPIHIMGDHYHGKGELMLSYRFMPMFMEGNLQGSDEVNNQAIFNRYNVAPQEMQMNMHMIGFMYGVSEQITLTAMTNYISNSMDLTAMNGTDFTTENANFGDVSLSAMIKVLNENRQSFHANLGVSIPTGSVDERDDTPNMTDAVLGYPMQTGSGTFDPFVQLTYLKQFEVFSLGGQIDFKARLGENSENYTLGESFGANVWVAHKISKNFSFSLSGEFQSIKSIEGVNLNLNEQMMPLFDVSNTGRDVLSAGLGFNYYVPNGAFKDFRFGLEYQLPVWQDVNGIQMEQTQIISGGIQYTLSL